MHQPFQRRLIKRPVKGNTTKFRGGEQRIQRDLLRMTDKSAIGLKDLGGTTRFTLEGITCDMRGSHIRLVKQRHVKIRLRLPNVQHDA